MRSNAGRELNRTTAENKPNRRSRKSEPRNKSESRNEETWLRLSSGHCAYHEKWLGASEDLLRQREARRLVRQVLFASEEAHKGPALQRDMIAHRSAQDRIASFQRIQHRAQRSARADL